MSHSAEKSESSEHINASKYFKGILPFIHKYSVPICEVVGVCLVPLAYVSSFLLTPVEESLLTKTDNGNINESQSFRTLICVWLFSTWISTVVWAVWRNINKTCTHQTRITHQASVAYKKSLANQKTFINPSNNCSFRDFINAIVHRISSPFNRFINQIRALLELLFILTLSIVATGYFYLVNTSIKKDNLSIWSWTAAAALKLVVNVMSANRTHAVLFLVISFLLYFWILEFILNLDKVLTKSPFSFVESVTLLQLFCLALLGSVFWKSHHYDFIQNPHTGISFDNVNYLHCKDLELFHSLSSSLAPWNNVKWDIVYIDIAATFIIFLALGLAPFILYGILHNYWIYDDSAGRQALVVAGDSNTTESSKNDKCDKSRNTISEHEKTSDNQDSHSTLLPLSKRNGLVTLRIIATFGFMLSLGFSLYWVFFKTYVLVLPLNDDHSCHIDIAVIQQIPLLFTMSIDKVMELSPLQLATLLTQKRWTRLTTVVYWAIMLIVFLPTIPFSIPRKSNETLSVLSASDDSGQRNNLETRQIDTRQIKTRQNESKRATRSMTAESKDININSQKDSQNDLMSQNDFRRRLLLARKLYHFLAAAVFLPPLVAGEELFVAFSFIVGLHFLCLCEIFRKLNIAPMNKLIRGYIGRLLEERDSSSIILIHIHLLIGFAVPVIFEVLRSYFFDTQFELLAASQGILSAGIADSFAAIVGSRWTRCDNQSLRKSFTGFISFNIAYCLSSFVLLFTCSTTLLSYSTFSVVVAVIVCGFTSAVYEVYTKDVDNLVVPILSYAMFRISILTAENICRFVG